MPLPWARIAGFASVGALMGALTVVASLPTWVEGALWTLAAVAFWLPVTLRANDPRPLVTLLVAGTLAGVLTGLLQAGFAEGLLARNEAYAGSFPEGATATTRLVLFGSALGMGVFWGALWGGIAWGLQRLQARRAGAATTKGA